MMASVLQPEIHELVEQKNFAALKAAIRDMEIHDLTDLISGLSGEDLAMVFRLLPADNAADIFGDLDIEKQEELLETLSSEKVADILNDMPPDERTELLEELPGELAQRLLNSLRGDELRIARSLLAYPQESIGRLMTPEYVAIRPEWTIKHVLAHIRRVAPAKETLNVLYVVDEHWKLLDEMRLEQIILAEPDQTVRQLMDDQVAFLKADDDQETAVELFRKYEAVALPVVDSRGVLVGIVTFDDVMEVAEEEDTEDFQMVTGMAALESSYFATGFVDMLRKRLPWLAVLLAAETLTTIALLGFDRLPLFAALVLFVPLINSPAGNTGSQMAGLMIRGLAVAEIGLGDWKRVLLRELGHGLALGAVLAVLGFAAAWLFSNFAHAKVDPGHVALSVAIALAVAVTLANLMGSMLPLLFKRMGLDPAVTSGPFLASLMDVSGVLIYFGVASTILAAMN
ncbi:MAG: magnesium transporter [Planctomycetes bacterium]|nr:magnesium transporter [Planctomycetota bacterium]